MKIAMSGLISEQNFGDPIIERSAKWVYQDVCRRLGIDDVDWVDADLDVEKTGGVAFYGCRVARKLNLLWLLKVFVFILSFRYEKMLRGCRFGVISGGGSSTISI